MVFHTSDSCGTLVSLEPNNNGRTKNEVIVPHNQVVHDESSSSCYWDWPSSERSTGNDQQYVPTCLYHPRNSSATSDDDDDGYDSQSFYGSPVYLPCNTSEYRVDECLKHVPEIVERCDELLANPPRHFTSGTTITESLLYVHQGEVAHHAVVAGATNTTSQQQKQQSTDLLLVSDKATTCHILALRSTTRCSSSNLTSMAHIDGTGYEQCIRAMFQEHSEYHVNDDESKSDSFDLDIYILGGFDDLDGTSITISNWLLNVLATIASENKTTMKSYLKLCCISSLNDDGYSCPIGRGIAINTRTGETFLAKVDSSSSSDDDDDESLVPALTLRSARLFTTGSDRRLSIIHRRTSRTSSSSGTSEIRIEPFRYESFPEIQQLLELPDEVLLRYMSTSPNVEESCFCSSLRRTLRYIRAVDCTTNFGPSIDQPLIYRRNTNSNNNAWTRC